MKNPDFEVPSINTNCLTLVKEDRSFAGEVSSIPGNQPPMHRIYNDACDVGFYLESDRTGGKILMVFEKTQENQEGEIQAWIYVPASSREGRVTKVVLFND